ISVNNLIDLAARGKGATWSAAFLKGVAQGTRQAGADILGLQESGDKLMNAFLVSGEDVSNDWAQLINTVKINTGSYTDRLLTIIESETGDVRKKAAAVSLLSRSENMVATIKSLIGTTRPVEVQTASLEWLSKNITSDKEFCDQITMRWPTLSSPVRSKSIDLMMLNDERIGSLLTALEDSVVNTSAIGWRRSVNLMNSEVDMIKVRSRALLDPYKENAGDLLASYGNVNETTGDFEAGREVFTTSCALCHTIGESMGTYYGPDLSSVKNQTKSAVLKHILDPNASISNGFELWSVKKKDGSSLQGILIYEDVNTMVLATAPGEETTVQRGEITDFRIIDMSAMPVGLGNAIGKKDMEDLLEFIKEFKRSDL
ncbi:MAG: c-type cytochrome, partial [Cyclobacteriaceae bacterium]|nr:c-type cytochrome [Cyclobacteriaceae bacterium]